MKEALYKILDMLTLGKGLKTRVSGFEVRLPTRYHKYFKPDYEQENIRFLNETLKKGMTVIDVGAHIGLLTTIMAQKVGTSGRVYSFEPTPSTFRLLQKTIEINDLASVVMPFQKAVSDTRGTTTFYITDIVAHNSNSLANNKRTQGNDHGIEVDLISIGNLVQDFQIPRVDFIKIDAEGAELAVLKGAAVVIDAHKPKMLLALHPEAIRNFGDSLAEIWDFVKSKGYRVSYRREEITKDFFTSQTGLFDVFLT
jgi:FkbM family methyltransferase